MTRRFEIALTFRKVPCDRCGGERLHGERCPACGLKPHFAETQPQVQRRNRTVQQFRSQREPVDASWEDAQQLLDRIGSTIDALSNALSGVADGEEDPKELVLAFRELDRTVAAWIRPHPRPRRNWARTVGQALEALRDAAETFTEALVAPTALAAQELGRRGRKAFTHAAEQLDRLAEHKKYAAFDSGDASVFVQQMMSSNLDELENPSLTQLDEILRRRYLLSPSASVGAGVELDLYRPSIVLALDEERVERLAHSVESTLSSPLISGLAASSSWVEEHGRVTALLSTAVTTAFMDIEEQTELQVTDRLLDMVLKLKEGHARHLLATLLHVQGGDYEELRSKPTGAVFKQAESRFPWLQLEGLNRILRNAAGHSDFNVDETGVTIREHGKMVSLPVATFLNDVLEYFELSIILQVGLVRACAEMNINLPASRHLSSADRRAAIAAVAAAMGWQEVEVRALVPVCRITASGAKAQFVTAGYALARIMPERAESMYVDLLDEDGVHECEVDLARMKGTDLSGDVLTVVGALQMANVAICHRVDGETAWSSKEWVSLAHAVAFDASTSAIGRLRGLHVLRQLTDELGIRELAVILTQHSARLRAEVEASRDTSLSQLTARGTAFSRAAEDGTSRDGHFGGHFGPRAPGIWPETARRIR